MRAEISCPYCNALVPLAGLLPAGQRVACPRCGDTFPYLPPEGYEANGAPPPAALASDEAKPIPEPPPAPRRLPNWAIAAAVLSGMGVMAALGLMFALSTVLTRREHDRHSPKGEILSVPVAARIALAVYLLSLVCTMLWEWHRRRRSAAAGTPSQSLLGRWATPLVCVTVLVGAGLGLLSIQTRPAPQSRNDYPGGPVRVRAVPPAALTALGYLPDDTNLILGIHVAEAMLDPIGRELLVKAPPGAGDERKTYIEKLTSIQLADIDHVVLGVKSHADIPQVTLVVQTLRPYDVEQVVKTLKAARGSKVGDRTLYRVNPEGLSLNGYLWCPNERTLVFTLRAADYEHVPPNPRTGIDHLPEAVRTFLKDRMRPAAQFWAVGHVEDRDKAALQTVLQVYPVAWLKDNWAILSTVRTFGTWWECDGGIRLKAAFECTDAASAQALQKWFLAEENGEKKVLRRLALWPEAERIFRALDKTLKLKQTDAWVTLQAGAEVVGEQR